MKRPLRWVAAVLEQQMETVVHGAAEGEVTGWSVDSRTVQPGDLFVALRGPNHDGNRYAGDALARGAVGAVVDAAEAAGGGPVIEVRDSLAALQCLASEARREWGEAGGQVVAVTGSAGKTTTKDVIAEMLAVKWKTSKTQGNLNNHVGLPLSLLRIDGDSRAAVLELGMNHAGEIRALARIARPQAGVVTNVGWAHMESFDSIEAVAAAKRELVEELGPEGIAVLNADDERVAAFAASHRGRTILYGESAAADVRAEDVAYSGDGVRFRVNGVRFESPMPGRHGVSNLLAGIAVAGIFGIPPDRLTAVAARLKPGEMRGRQFSQGGVLVYNDCYNSNPDAARAMLDLLAESPAKRRIAVLGEMLELGSWAEALHRDVGNHAVARGVDVLVGIRGAACHMLDAAKRAGLRADAAFFFEDSAAAGQLVGSIARPGDAILFKGSRGVHVERALQEFLAVLPSDPPQEPA